MRKGVIIGLTGGIACGKTTVAQLLKEKGVKVVDVDAIGHRLLEKNTPTYKKVVEEFGAEILSEKGGILRGKLGKVVFADKEKLKKLNQIVHPTLIKLAKEEAFRLASESAESGHVVVIDAALLVELGLHKIADLILVIISNEREQIKRIIERSRNFGEPISEEEAKRRIETQSPLREKEKFADYVIDNSGSMDELKEKIEKITNILDL